MNKRFVVKLAVTVATLTVVTLLQGCYQEEDSLVLSMAWAPVGFSPAQQPAFAPSSASNGRERSGRVSGRGSGSGGNDAVVRLGVSCGTSIVERVQPPIDSGGCASVKD